MENENRAAALFLWFQQLAPEKILAFRQFINVLEG